MGLIDIASIMGIISDRHRVADDMAISKWHDYLGIADEEVRCLSDIVWSTPLLLTWFNFNPSMAK